METLISESIPPKLYNLAAGVAARHQSDASASEAQLRASGTPVVEPRSCQHAVGKFHCILTVLWLYGHDRYVSRWHCLLVVM